MEEQAIKEMIEKGMTNCEVTITGDGRHFEAIIISEQFAGKHLVQRQQLVYRALGESFASGELHALSMKTYTPQEWKQQNG